MNTGDVYVKDASNFTDILKELYEKYKGVLTYDEFIILMNSKDTYKEQIELYNKLVDFGCPEISHVFAVEDCIFTPQE